MSDAIGRPTPRKYVPRFAGEAFLHAANSHDGPMARKLISEVAWKRPPSAKVSSEVSV
jgi:hypothetical protein